jgi:hypothetical protein
MPQPETNTELLMEFDSVRMRSNMVIFKKVKISKFSKIPINFKISKKSKKKIRKFQTFKLSKFSKKKIKMITLRRHHFYVIREVVTFVFSKPERHW